MLGRTQGADEHIARWRQRIWLIVRAARVDECFRTASGHEIGDSGLLARRGWHALHEGRIELARRCFQAALHHDPYTLSAWLGLSRVAGTRSERRAYLQAALDIHFLLTDPGRCR